MHTQQCLVQVCHSAVRLVIVLLCIFIDIFLIPVRCGQPAVLSAMVAKSEIHSGHIRTIFIIVEYSVSAGASASQSNKRQRM